MGSWEQVQIAGKTADVFTPEHASATRFGVIFLHGVGLETLNGNEVYTRLLNQHGLACVCPHGQKCWWTDRIFAEFDAHVTPERYVLDSVVPYFYQKWNIAPRAIGLLGISMGGQGALRMAFKHPATFPVVAAISSAIEYHEKYGQGTAIDAMYDSKEQCRQDTAIMHVPPYNPPPHIFFCIDPMDARLYRGNDRLHEKLNALGIEHTCDLTTQAGGHSWQYFNHMAEPAIRFLVEGLQKESLRLL